MDLIKALKENEKPFGLMSKEMQDKAEEIGKPEFHYYTNEWCEYNDSISASCFQQEATYRLRSDYKEDEVVKCKILPPNSDGYMFVQRAEAHTMDFGSCIMHKDFIGFLYEDGKVASHPRIYKHLFTKDFFYRVDIDVLSAYKVLTPTHVLFKGTKK